MLLESIFLVPSQNFEHKKCFMIVLLNILINSSQIYMIKLIKTTAYY